MLMLIQHFNYNYIIANQPFEGKGYDKDKRKIRKYLQSETELQKSIQ